MREAVPLDLNDPVQAEAARRLDAHYRKSFRYEGGEYLVGTGLDLSGKLLDEVYLHKAHLENCRFEEAGLTRANLSSTHMVQCSFREANLREANFVKAWAYACDFRETDMEECNLIKLGTAECDFRQARLRGSRMLRFTGTSGDFRGADLRDVTFLQTAFRDALMAGVDLAGASGTIARNDHAINVGTPEEPRLLRDEELLEWFRAGGAQVEWDVP